MPTGIVSLDDPSRPHPPRHPPGALGVLRLEPRQLDAGVRAVNERLLADIHPHVRDAAARLGREQEDVSGSQSFDDWRDFGSGARLVSTHARQADAVLAVGPLHQSGAIESIVGGTAPDVGRTERIQRRVRSEEHTSELQSLAYLVCRLLLEKKKTDAEAAETPLRAV